MTLINPFPFRTMYIKHLVLFIFMAAISQTAKTQHQIGISNGPVFPSYKSYKGEQFKLTNSAKYYTGYSARGFFRIGVTRHYFQKYELSLENRKLDYQYFYGDAQEFTADSGRSQMRFAGLHFMNEIQLHQSIPIFIGLGFSGYKLFSMTESGTYEEQTAGPAGVYTKATYNNKTTSATFIDIGLALSLAYYQKLNDRINIFAQALYKQSVNPFNTDTRYSIVGLRMNDFRFDIGVTFSLDKPKKTEESEDEENPVDE